MKTTFVAKAGSIVLACSILAVFLIPNGFASRFGEVQDRAPVAGSCSDKVSAFPAFFYTKLFTNSNGAISGFEIRASSADSRCSSVLYSSSSAEGRTYLSTQQDSDEMVIALR